MNSLELNLWVLEVSSAAATFAMNWLLQSTLLLSVGLFAAWRFRRRGSAFQSVVYRTTLAAVLACPVVSLALSLAGTSGWSLELPPTYTRQQPRPLESSAPIGPDDFGAIPPVTGSDGGTSWEADHSNVVAQRFDSSPRSDAIDDMAVDAPGRPDWQPERAATEAAVVTRSPRAVMESVETVGTTQANTGVLNIFGFGVAAIAFVIVWAATASVLAVRLALVMMRTNRLRRQAVAAGAAEFEVCDRIASEMRVSTPHVLRSPFVTSPCLHGLRRPAVILPADTELQFADVFVHELAHLRRRDCHWMLARQMTTTILFFQPLLWWLARRMDATAEEVCDDYVVQFGGNREGYANSLVNIAALSAPPASRLAIAGVGMVSLRSMLSRRVGRIMDTSRSLSTRVGRWLMLIVIGGGLAGTTVAGLIGLSSNSSAGAAAGHEAGAVAANRSPADDRIVVPANSSEAVSEAERAFDPGESRDGGGRVVTLPSQSSLETTSSTKPSEQSGRRSEQPRTAAAEPEDAQNDKTDSLGFGGRVTGPDGKPLPGADVFANLPARGISGLKAVTDKEGRFEFQGDRDALNKAISERARYRVTIIAHVEGLAQDWRMMTMAELPDSSIEMQLREFVPVKGRIVSAEGRPLANIEVSPADISRPANGLQEYMRRATEDRLTYAATVDQWSMGGRQTTRTDADGRFEFEKFGAERVVKLRLHGDGVADSEIVIMTRAVPATSRDTGALRTTGTRNVPHYFAEFTHVAPASRTLQGIVVDEETGEPIEGIAVGCLASRGGVTTKADGRFRFPGCLKADGYQFTVRSRTQPYFGRSFKVADTDGLHPLDVEIELQRGITAKGYVTDGEKPLGGVVYYNVVYPSPFADRIIGNVPFQGYSEAVVHPDGRFEIPVLPGPGVLTFTVDRSANRDATYLLPRVPREELNTLLGNAVGGRPLDGRRHLSIHAGGPQISAVGLVNHQALTLISPDETDREIEARLTAIPGRNLSGTVVDANGKPANRVHVSQLLPGQLELQPIAGNEFVVRGVGAGHPRRIVFYQPDARQGAVLDLTGDEQSEPPLSVTLKSCGILTGRLVDAKGKPVKNALVVLNRRNYGGNPNTWSARSGENGDFRVEGLVPGETYHGSLGAQTARGYVIRDVVAKPGETVELGDVEVPDRLMVSSSN